MEELSEDSYILQPVNDPNDSLLNKQYKNAWKKFYRTTSPELEELFRWRDDSATVKPGKERFNKAVRAGEASIDLGDSKEWYQALMDWANNRPRILAKDGDYKLLLSLERKILDMDIPNEDKIEGLRLTAFMNKATLLDKDATLEYLIRNQKDFTNLCLKLGKDSSYSMTIDRKNLKITAVEDFYKMEFVKGVPKVLNYMAFWSPNDKDFAEILNSIFAMEEELYMKFIDLQLRGDNGASYKSFQFIFPPSGAINCSMHLIWSHFKDDLEGLAGFLKRCKNYNSVLRFNVIRTLLDTIDGDNSLPVLELPFEWTVNTIKNSN